MGQFHKIEEMLTGELMKIGSEGKLTNTSLEVGDKAAHFLKSIKTIEASHGYALTLCYQLQRLLRKEMQRGLQRIRRKRLNPESLTEFV